MPWYGDLPDPPYLPPDFGSIWGLTGSLRDLMDLMMPQLSWPYWDPVHGRWFTPTFSVTVYTTMPRQTGTPWNWGIMDPFGPPRAPEPTSPGPPTDLWSALVNAGVLIDQPPPDLAADLERIWNLTRDLREILDILLMHRLVRSYWDPDRNEWVTPDYSVTVYTTTPEETTTPPGETTRPTEPPFPGWIFNPMTGVWEPQPPIVFTTTVYTSVVEETTEEPPEEPPPPPPLPPPHQPPRGWRLDPFTGAWVPYPPVVFSTTVYTTVTGEVVVEPPEEPELPGRPLFPFPPYIVLQPPYEGTPPYEPYQPDEPSPPPDEPPPPPPPGAPPMPPATGGGGGGAPLPGPPAPVIGTPLGESVWRLGEYVPIFTPPIGYYIAGR